MRSAAEVFRPATLADEQDASLYGRLGMLLGLQTILHSELELAERIEKGLSVSVVQTLRGRIGFSDAEMSALVAPRRTLARRATLAQPLSHQEADSAVRVARVTARAQQVFAGKPEYVGEWLRAPNPALNGRTPMQALATDAGARAVEEMLIGIDYGLFQ